MAALPHFHMWAVFAVIVLTIMGYANEKWPMEVVSLCLISILLVLFHLFPLVDASGKRLIAPEILFRGFSNEALITVISFLVIGQAVIMSGAVAQVGHGVARLCRHKPYLSIAVMLVVVCVISAFMNNTPVVVIFIPILAALARKVGLPVSSVMIPLAYAASLGGITTLIGTSTNVLIAGKVKEMGLGEIGFFDFFVPGALLCGVGLIYTVLILPRLLPDRSSLSEQFRGGDDTRQFLTEIEVGHGSSLAGKAIHNDLLPVGKDIPVRLVQRGEASFTAPLEPGFVLEVGDVVVTMATRQRLSALAQKHPDILISSVDEPEEGRSSLPRITSLVSSEVVVAPGSRMIGQTPEMLGLKHRYNMVVLGIQRGSLMMRSKMSGFRLQAGDVMLVLSPRDSLQALAATRDVLLLEDTLQEIPNRTAIRRVNLIFFSVIALATLEVMPISLLSFIGATLVVLTGCLNIRQATRAVDRQVFLLIATAYMLSLAMERTGGAEAIAGAITSIDGLTAFGAMALLFFIMILFNEIMSNNAAGLLFTPIAVSIAEQMGADPKMFIWAVIFAGSCSFATPIGYQTNLLVMAPGHYKFTDYVKAGLPLNVLLMITYLIYSAVVFGV